MSQMIQIPSRGTVARAEDQARPPSVAPQGRKSRTKSEKSRGNLEDIWTRRPLVSANTKAARLGRDRS
jgi:hypothetical protein